MNIYIFMEREKGREVFVVTWNILKTPACLIIHVNSDSRSLKMFHISFCSSNAIFSLSLPSLLCSLSLCASNPILSVYSVPSSLYAITTILSLCHYHHLRSVSTAIFSASTTILSLLPPTLSFSALTPIVSLCHHQPFFLSLCLQQHPFSVPPPPPPSSLWASNTILWFLMSAWIFLSEFIFKKVHFVK